MLNFKKTLLAVTALAAVSLLSLNASAEVPAQTVKAVTATTYTFLQSDCSKLVTFSNGSAVAVTLPQAGTAGAFFNGCFIDVENKGAGTVTITPTTSTINGASSFALVTGQGTRIASDSTNYQIQQGQGSGPGITQTAVASTVDTVNITPSATGTPGNVQVTAVGTDANINLSLVGKGTTGNVLIGGNTTTLAGLQIAQPASRINDFLLTPGATGTAPTFLAGGAGSDAALAATFGTAGTGTISFDTSTTEVQLQLLRTASAVNNLTITGSTGTSPVLIAAAGTGGTIPISIAAKSTGAVLIGGTTTTNAGLQVAQPASAVNDIIVTPAATGSVPSIVLGGAGADATKGLAINGVGTGAGSGVLLGGTSTTNSPLQVIPGSATVNDIVVTGTNTGTAPTITLGGAGADANRNLAITAAGTGLVQLGGTGGTGGLSCAASGATPVTCSGQRGIATTTSLNTAALTDTTYTVTNTSVTTSSLVLCTIQTYSAVYSTNGDPIIMSCVPGSGSFVVNIRNMHATNALAGTIGIGFTVMN